MLASVIAAFLYLRIMVSMWIADAEPGDDTREPVRAPLSTTLAVVLAVGFTLAVGVAPGWIISAAQNATAVAGTLGP
jgi:NADH-quinone oxidoreductase subunit N